MTVISPKCTIKLVDKYYLKMNITKVAILAPILMNFILLFNRKKKWVISSYKWYVVIGLLFISIIILSFTNIELLDGNQLLAIWGMMTPTIFSLLDYLFRIISKKIHNRDLYLWLRGSSDIDDSKISGGKHVKTSDRVFSMILLFTIIVLPFMILIIK